MTDSPLIDERFRGQPTESLADYETYWWWDADDTGGMGTSVHARFLGFTEFDNTFPLAILELERPIELWGVQYPIVVAGAKAPPNTVKWVFRWPLAVNLIGVLDKEKLGVGPLARNEVQLLRVGNLEPVVFEGSPHWNLTIPGGLGEDLVWKRLPDGSLPPPVWVPPVKWWV